MNILLSITLTFSSSRFLFRVRTGRQTDATERPTPATHRGVVGNKCCYNKSTSRNIYFIVAFIAQCRCTEVPKCN